MIDTEASFGLQPRGIPVDAVLEPIIAQHVNAIPASKQLYELSICAIGKRNHTLCTRIILSNFNIHF